MGDGHLRSVEGAKRFAGHADLNTAHEYLAEDSDPSTRAAALDQLLGG